MSSIRGEAARGVGADAAPRAAPSTGGLKADDASRLRELERENARLKRIVADQPLENQALKESAKGNWVRPSRRREAVPMLIDRLRLSERRA